MKIPKNFAGVCMLALFFNNQPASGQDNSIPKTKKPLMIESKKKPVHKWVEKETYTIDQLNGYKSKPDPEYSKYGGMAGTQFPAKGFFYTQKVKDRWWLVDPEGHLFIHKAVCSGIRIMIRRI